MSLLAAFVASGSVGVAAPVNSVAPAVTGAAYASRTLTCSTGTWSGSPTYTYQWQHGTTNISGATSSTYVVSTSYIGETIRCVVTATNSGGPTSANSNATASIGPVTGQVEFAGYVETTWVCPAGVTSVSMVLVGQAGGDTSGGNLGYKNNYSVTPGNTYNIVAGGPGGPSATQRTSFINDATISVGNRNVGANQWTGVDAAFTGGIGTLSGGIWSGGGGAAGYAGNGGDGFAASFDDYGNGYNGTGGAGGGGGGAQRDANQAAPGGGVGLKGQGTSGTGGTATSSSANSGNPGSGGSGQTYGGGQHANNGTLAGSRGIGGIRLMWPGDTRSYPSTNTGDL